MVDPTPQLRRHDRRLAGGSGPQVPDVRVACVDWAPIVRLVSHVANALADNATTQVVDRKLTWEFFGGLIQTDFGAPTHRDIELTPVDPKAVEKNRELMLRKLASRMAQGPDQLAAGLAELERERASAVSQLKRKLAEVRTASAADADRFENWAVALQGVQLVCDVVTIWTPAGRVAKVVKAINSTKDYYEGVEKVGTLVRQVGGVSGIVAVVSDPRQRELVAKVFLQAGLDFAKDKAMDKAVGWAGEKLSRGVGRGMLGQNSPAFDARPYGVDWHGEEVRKYTTHQVKQVMWKVRHGVETLGKAPDLFEYLDTAAAAWYQRNGPEEKVAGPR